MSDSTFDAAYASLYPEMVRVAYLLTLDPQEAHDVAQECFVAALRSWDEIEQPAAYLRRSVAYRSSTVRRDRARRRLKAERSAPPAGDEAGGETEFLADVIAALPDRQRVAIVLKYYLGFSTREIAEAMHVRPGTVGPTITRALARMKEQLDEPVE